MSHPTPTVPTKPASELLRSLEQLGYTEGPPAQLSADWRDIDAQLCRSMRCPGCRKRGMQYRPLHRRCQYAAVAVCGHCGAGEEI